MMRERAGLAVLAGLLAFALADRAAAQGGLDPAALLNPPADSWPTYHGDYSGQRHSKLTQITPANVGQLTLAWALQSGQTAADQSDADPRQRRHLRLDARQPLGDRRAIGAADLALPLPGQHRLPHRPPRRRRLQGLRLPHHAGRASRRARRERRHRQVERRHRRREEGLLVHQRAAAGPQPPAGRRVRRFRQPAGHPEVVRSGDRQDCSGRSTARRRRARRAPIAAARWAARCG